MYIYNGKLHRDVPSLRDFNKKILVDKESVLLTFVGKENLSKEILYTFAVDYYNTPIESNSAFFDRLVDIASLEKVVKEYLKGEKFLEIKRIRPREVIISLNLEKWLSMAIRPLNISRKKGVGTYYITSNIKPPSIFQENFSPEDNTYISRLLRNMLSKSDYYIRRFRGSFPKEMIFREHKTLNFIDLAYDLYSNRFEITIKNNILQMLYFKNLGRQ